MPVSAASQQIASIPVIHNPPDVPKRRRRTVTLAPEERRALWLARRKKGITLKAIARRIGIDHHLLARYQCGERRPPQAVLQAWRRELSS